jgi:hypothetical protein
MRWAMAFVPEGRRDRSLARSAWDSVTQKSRPVGYGPIRAGVRIDSMIGVTRFRIHNTAHIFDEKYPYDVWDSYARSYRALRDGSLAGRFPRHFVPGYDHAVPPGRNTVSAPGH